jgi:hypothetical protein
MKKTIVDRRRCPLYGNSNERSVAAGEKSCWCFSQPIPPGVLQKLPAEACGVMCVYRACATKRNALERALAQLAKVLPL